MAETLTKTTWKKMNFQGYLPTQGRMDQFIRYLKLLGLHFLVLIWILSMGILFLYSGYKLFYLGLCKERLAVLVAIRRYAARTSGSPPSRRANCLSRVCRRSLLSGARSLGRVSTTRPPCTTSGVRGSTPGIAAETI